MMRAIEASSRNEAVIQQAQNEVRSAQASIKFLEDQLAQLQVGGSPMRDGSGSGTPGYSPGMMTPSKGVPGQVMSPSPSRRGDMDRPLPPPPEGQDGPKPQKNYTNLGGSVVVLC